MRIILLFLVPAIENSRSRSDFSGPGNRPDLLPSPVREAAPAPAPHGGTLPADTTGRFRACEGENTGPNREINVDTPGARSYVSRPFRRRENPAERLKMKTFSAKPAEVERKWYLIDAADQILGKVAVEAARLLRGKHKATFTPHVDTGDHVVIINAAKVRLSGNKETQKIYTSHSGYVGGQKVETPKKVRARKPELLVERAVRGMIPHHRLGRAQFRKLRVYAGAEHEHEAQQPEQITL